MRLGFKLELKLFCFFNFGYCLFASCEMVILNVRNTEETFEDNSKFV